MWGTQEHLVELFGHAVTDIRSQERDCVWRFTSSDEFVTFFRRWYGPTLKAFGALDDAGRDALAADLADLAGDYDRHGDGGSIAIPASYLETVLSLR